MFIGRTEAETPILWPPDAKSWLIWKDPDAAKDWRWEEKVVTEDEMVGWHHQLNGCEFFIFLFYNTVLVLPYIDINPPQVYMSSQPWTPLPPPSPYHLSGSSQCTSPRHPVSCIEPRLAIRFLHENMHVSMSFSQIIPPSPSPSESKILLYTSVSFLLSCIQGHHCHLSKFHIYVLVYCIGVFLSGLLHSV